MKTNELGRICKSYHKDTDINIVDCSNFAERWLITEVTDNESDGSLQIHIVRVNDDTKMNAEIVFARNRGYIYSLLDDKVIAIPEDPKSS